MSEKKPDKKRHCWMHSEETKIRCKRRFYISMKVQVRHSDTGRRTWQTWQLCEHHFDLFVNNKGEGYYSWYKHKPFKKAFVIDFKVIGVI